MARPRSYTKPTFVVTLGGRVLLLGDRRYDDMEASYYGRRMRKGRSTRNRGYYLLSDGRWVRQDTVKRFQGMVINQRGLVRASGDPRHGILLVPGGRPTLIAWQNYVAGEGGRPPAAIAKWPAVRAAIDWLRKGVK